MEEPIPPSRTVHAEPRRCTDRRPSSWLLLCLLALFMALMTYVVLSASSVPDHVALAAAGFSLVVILLVFFIVNYARRQAEPGRQSLGQRLGLTPKEPDEGWVELEETTV